MTELVKPCARKAKAIGADEGRQGHLHAVHHEGGCERVWRATRMLNGYLDERRPGARARTALRQPRHRHRHEERPDRPRHPRRAGQGSSCSSPAELEATSPSVRAPARSSPRSCAAARSRSPMPATSAAPSRRRSSTSRTSRSSACTASSNALASSETPEGDRDRDPAVHELLGAAWTTVWPTAPTAARFLAHLKRPARGAGPDLPVDPAAEMTAVAREPSAAADPGRERRARGRCARRTSRPKRSCVELFVHMLPHPLPRRAHAQAATRSGRIGFVGLHATGLEAAHDRQRRGAGSRKRLVVVRACARAEPP